MSHGKSCPASIMMPVIIASVIFILLAIGLPKPPQTSTPGSDISVKDMILDISLFQTATLSYSFLVTSTSFNSGVGSEIMNNGSFSRGVGEFFSFWKYETRYQVGNVDPNKSKKTFFWHPLLGYEYTNYLMTRGYSKKRAFLTSMIAVYIFEKGLQGSFETPSMYDFFSYASGITTSILIHNASRRLYEADHFILKGIGLALNPFFLMG